MVCMRPVKRFVASCPECGHCVSAGNRPDPLSNFPYLRNTHEMFGGKLVCPNCSGVNVMKTRRA